MSSRRGAIALMGSGELTSTMVEVHKELLGSLSGVPRAVFLDTPAGFQLNAEDLAQRAVRYFRDRVGHALTVVSFKSRTGLTAYDAERAYRTLRDAHYLLIGPGSPTYAVSQWQDTPIPEIFIQRIESGACLVAASAAALTVGRFTLPVYEIYKVGQSLHWVEGLHLLERFGFPLVVIPHWNNAEGGTHDTRFCYMGEPRFKELEVLLPSDVAILGLDEHTACLLDLETGEARVRGIGRVTLRRNTREMVFERGANFSLDVLRGALRDHRWQERDRVRAEAVHEVAEEDSSFWRQVQEAEAAFEKGVEGRHWGDLVNALLELDRIVWQGQQDFEDPEFIAQARERFRELVVRLGSVMEGSPADRVECLAPLVEAMLRLRERYRREKRWSDADLLRETLHEAGVVVEDAPSGVRWELHRRDG
jgi:cyanophycinase-like exopeptidase